jgi:hypothetical protein
VDIGSKALNKCETTLKNVNRENMNKKKILIESWLYKRNADSIEYNYNLLKDSMPKTFINEILMIQLLKKLIPKY